MINIENPKGSYRRRSLLPLWIKIFLWLFMVTGILAPFALIAGLIGLEFNLSLYGLETYKPMSIYGFLIIILFSLKGLVSISLWTEKSWALDVAKYDAIIGILICSFVMFILPFISNANDYHLSIRLELIALIPYLIKMNSIKADWINAN